MRTRDLPVQVQVVPVHVEISERDNMPAQRPTDISGPWIARKVEMHLERRLTRHIELSSSSIYTNSSSISPYSQRQPTALLGKKRAREALLGKTCTRILNQTTRTKEKVPIGGTSSSTGARLVATPRGRPHGNAKGQAGSCGLPLPVFPIGGTWLALTWPNRARLAQARVTEDKGRDAAAYPQTPPRNADTQ